MRFKLDNGYELSVQQSSLHYCGAYTAEVAVLKDDEFITGYPGESSGVAGHVNALQLAAIIMWVSKQPSEHDLQVNAIFDNKDGLTP